MPPGCSNARLDGSFPRPSRRPGARHTLSPVSTCATHVGHAQGPGRVVNLPWHPPSAHLTPPGGGPAQSLLRGRGVRLPVVVPRPPDYGFFVARRPVHEQPPPYEHPSSGAGTAVMVPRAPHPNPVLDAALLTMLIPASLVPPDPAFLPGGPVGRIELPWRQDSQTGLLIPDHTLHRLWWDRSFSVRNNVTPHALGLPFDAADLADVAWAALARCPVHQLVRVLAVWAFCADVLGPGSQPERALAELLDLPGDLQPRLRGAVSDGGPLLDPRCLRWIIRELAAAQVAGQAAGWSGWEPADLAHEVIARVLFPVTLQANSSAVPFREVLRAVWLLHEGFQLGDDTTAEVDRPMSIVAAYTYGIHHSAGMLRFLDRGRRLLEVDDAHLAVAGFSPRPSALREAFTHQTGLTTTQWMRGAAAVAVRYFIWVANARPQPGHLGPADGAGAACAPVGQLPRSGQAGAGHHPRGAGPRGPGRAAARRRHLRGARLDPYARLPRHARPSPSL
jgi:hypothetical protein